MTWPLLFARTLAASLPGPHSLCFAAAPPPTPTPTPALRCAAVCGGEVHDGQRLLAQRRGHLRRHGLGHGQVRTGGRSQVHGARCAAAAAAAARPPACASMRACALVHACVCACTCAYVCPRKHTVCVVTLCCVTHNVCSLCFLRTPTRTRRIVPGPDVRVRARVCVPAGQEAANFVSNEFIKPIKLEFEKVPPAMPLPQHCSHTAS
jgi:hypothetical protein